MATAIVAEKPSVARHLARVLGAEGPGPDGYEGGGFVVTWLVGHVAELMSPAEMEPAWRVWRLEDLPLLPPTIPWRVSAAGRARFEVAARVVHRPDVDQVICATDAGREGELIFRTFADLAGLDKPVLRLWVSSMTDAALAAGLNRLRPGHELEPLADAARLRAWVDWWVGMNASRALSLTYRETFFGGRVQTPTLAAVVQRDDAVRAHDPVRYAEVEVGLPIGTALLFRGPDPSIPAARRFSPEEMEPGSLENELLGAELTVRAAVDRREFEVEAPRLFDLDGLQRKASDALGWTALQTLQAAQRLYERHRLITYPRTDSTYLGTSDAELTPAVRAVVEARRGLCLSGLPNNLAESYIDDAKVGEHPAIVPTPEPVSDALDPEEEALLSLIELRLLAALAGPARRRVETVCLESPRGRTFVSAQTVELVPGFFAFEPEPTSGTTEGWGPEVAVGARFAVGTVTVRHGAVPGPAHLNDGTLIELMAAQSLGTPATRADTIERLLSRGYLERRGRALWATASGRRLVEKAPSALTEVEMTAELEVQLAGLSAGEIPRDAVTERAHAVVRDLVSSVVAGAKRDSIRRPDAPAAVRTVSDFALPPWDGVWPDELSALIAEGLDEEVTRSFVAAVAGGSDAVVMAESAWVQSRYALLAAQARSGPVVWVVAESPVFIDDEVMQLRQYGLRIDRIHGETDVEASEAVAAAFVEATLPVLVVSPDRFGPELVETVAAARPSVVILDDLHRRSLGSADCSPPYRRVEAALGRLRRLHPDFGLIGICPPTSSFGSGVFNDLSFRAPAVFTPPWGASLALELVSCPVSQRAEALRRADLRGGSVLVRCSSRFACEDLAAALGCPAYHSGVSSRVRATLQNDFQAGRLPLLVASSALSSRLAFPTLETLVFAELPFGLERFLVQASGPGVLDQEVRVIVFHDPEEVMAQLEAREDEVAPAAALKMVLDAVGAKPQPSEGLRRASGLDRGLFERCLRNLLDGGGLAAEGGGLVVGPDAEAALTRQHLRAVLGQADGEALSSWLSRPACRLVGLTSGPAEAPCGLCDVCDPDGARIRRFRPPSNEETSAMMDLLAVLSRGPATEKQLFLAVQSQAVTHRARLRPLLEGLAAVGALAREEGRSPGANGPRYWTWRLAEPASEAQALLRMVRLDDG